jgi:anti-anti-sigma factor
VLEDDPVACSFVSTRDYAGCAVLALRGDLDTSDRAELSSRLAAVASCGPWVIVDLTNLAYMDCGSLGVLAAVRERARLAGGDVLLAGPRGAVAWMLLLTGRAGEFSVFPVSAWRRSAPGSRRSVPGWRRTAPGNPWPLRPRRVHLARLKPSTTDRSPAAA